MKCIIQSLYNFSKNMQFMHCNHHKFIFANEQMMFGGCRNFKTIQFGVGFLENVKIQVESNRNLLCSHYTFFQKYSNLCIAITINLYLPIRQMMFGGCRNFKTIQFGVRIFEKCQNLGGSNEMYYAAIIQFSKNVQFVHCNHHKFIFANK